MIFRIDRAFASCLGLGLLTSWMAACGDDAGSTGSGGAGTGSGGAGTGTGTGTGASASASGAGGDAANACPDLPADEPSAGPVEVRIRNGRAAPVYIGGSANACENVPPGATDPIGYFDLTNAAGESVAIGGRSEAFFCASLREAACGCEAVDCVAPAALKIAPGATYTYTWSGAAFDFIEAPEGCQDGCCASTQLGCSLQRAVQAGDLTVSVAASEPGDDTVCGSVDCGCTPDASGYCFIQGAIALGFLPVERTFAYPSETSVEVVIE
jgi:hypothetical protein